MKSLLVSLLLLIFCIAIAGCSSTPDTQNAGNTSVAGRSAGNQNVSSTNEVTQNISTKEEYPENVVQEFLKSCEAAGSDSTFCRCVLDKVQAKYTLEEFSVIESKMNAGQTPEEFVEFSGKVRAECTKKLGQ